MCNKCNRCNKRALKHHKQKLCSSVKDRDESHMASDELFASFLAEVEAEVQHGTEA